MYLNQTISQMDPIAPVEAKREKIIDLAMRIHSMRSMNTIDQSMNDAVALLKSVDKETDKEMEAAKKRRDKMVAFFKKNQKKFGNIIRLMQNQGGFSNNYPMGCTSPARDLGDYIDPKNGNGAGPTDKEIEAFMGDMEKELG